MNPRLRYVTAKSGKGRKWTLPAIEQCPAGCKFGQRNMPLRTRSGKRWFSWKRLPSLSCPSLFRLLESGSIVSHTRTFVNVANTTETRSFSRNFCTLYTKAIFPPRSPLFSPLHAPGRRFSHGFPRADGRQKRFGPPPSGRAPKRFVSVSKHSHAFYNALRSVKGHSAWEVLSIPAGCPPWGQAQALREKVSCECAAFTGMALILRP